MADDTSCLFEISDTPFIVHMSATYPKLKFLWQLYPLLSQLLSCVISTLCRNMCNRELLNI